MRNPTILVFVALALSCFSQTKLVPPGAPQPNVRPSTPMYSPSSRGGAKLVPPGAQQPSFTPKTSSFAQTMEERKKAEAGAPEVSVADAIEDAKKNGKVVVLNYTSSACGICVNKVSESRNLDSSRFTVVNLLSGNEQHMRERGNWFRSDDKVFVISSLPHVAVIDGKGERVDLLKVVEDSGHYKRFVEESWMKSDYKYRTFSAANGKTVKMRVESMGDKAVKVTLKGGPEREVPLLSLSHKDIDYLYKTTEHPTQYFAMREWSSADGRSMKGRMVGVKEDKVQMFLENGRKMVLPLEKLSSEDQTFARSAFPKSTTTE